MTNDRFIETMIGLERNDNDQNLIQGSNHQNLAEKSYLGLYENQKEGLELVLSENGSEAPYEFEHARFYQKEGPGVWNNYVQKSGTVKTCIPAR